MKQLPNLVSLLRLVLGPLLAWMILAKYPHAFAVFFVLAWSDALDGILARWLHASSELGTYLDPLADKVFVTVVSLAWWWVGVLPNWLLALIVARDVMILGGSAYVYWRTKRKDFAPSLWGKLSTIVQLCALGACFVFRTEVQVYFFWATALSTTLSGVDYARTGRIMLSNELPINSEPPRRVRPPLLP